MDLEKDLRKRNIDGVVKWLLKRKEENGGKVPRCSYDKGIKTLQNYGIIISPDALYKRVERASTSASAANESPPIAKVAVPLDAATADSATSPITFEESATSPPAAAASANVSSNNNTSPPVAAAMTNDNSSTPVSASATAEDSSSNTRNVGGRPKGTGIVQQKEKKDRLKKCLNAITTSYAATLDTNEDLGTSKNKLLQKIIAQKKAEFNIDEDISTNTIKSRIRRNAKNPGKHKLESSHPGIESPLAAAELILRDIVIQMQKIRQPMTKAEVINTMNAMIKGTELQDDLKQVKSKTVGQVDGLGEVGDGWYRNFMNRHRDVLTSTRGERFACNRDQWSTYEHIEAMYDGIYKEMADAGIAEKLDRPIFTDREGNEVSKDDPKRFGLEQEYKLTHPHLFFFADETGCNTSQKKDGHIGGRKYVCVRGTRPQTLASTSDHPFTLLPFTSATGEAVCCVVIFKCDEERLPGNWATGIDYFVEDPIIDENGYISLEKNFGKNKFYPGGPTCQYNGKEIPCLTFSSPSGGITGQILADILAEFDKLELAPRDDSGVLPFLLLDGHQSRLDPIFLKYINGDGHVWRVCLGVPYATTLWQVGDASELNGNFKIQWSSAKEELLASKYNLGLDRKIDSFDIIPLIRKTFHAGFNNKDANLKACADRGWRPMNRRLLQHPDLKRASDMARSTAESAGVTVAQSSSSSSNVELNIEEGAMAAALGKLLGHYEKTEHFQSARNAKKARREKVLEHLESAKKFTSGTFVEVGKYSLNDPTVREALDNRVARKEADALAVVERKKEALKKKADEVDALRKQFGHEREVNHQFKPFNFHQCGVYLQYKKQDGDDAMPKNVKDRRERCLEVCNRPSPTKASLSTEEIVEDGSNTNNVEETDAAVALSDIPDANEDNDKMAAL